MRMIDGFVMKLIQISVTTSFMILAVFLLRLIFRKLPKKYFCILWLAIFIRLVCPCDLSSSFSIIPVQMQELNFGYGEMQVPHLSTGIHELDKNMNLSMIFYHNDVTKGIFKNKAQCYSVPIITYTWMLVSFILCIYQLISLIYLKRHLRTAILEEKNIYRTDKIRGSFLYGVIRPKIYLKAGLTAKQREYVILHETEHAKRKDNVVKLFAFIVVIVYWFNPLVWISYYVMSRDIEMAVDESLCNQLERSKRIDYANIIYSLSVRQGQHIPIPAFGNNPTVKRVKNVLTWKKHKKVIVAVAILLLFFVSLCLGTNQKTLKRQEKRSAVQQTSNVV